MITSQVIAEVLAGVRTELTPFAFMPKDIFDENLSFEGAAHSTFVTDDVAIQALKDERNLVQIVWNRTPLTSETLAGRGKVAYSQTSDTGSRRFAVRSVKTDITISFFHTSISIAELMEEWIAVKDFSKLNGSITLDVNPGGTPKMSSLNWTGNDIRVGSLSRLDAQKYGTIFSLTVSLTVSYPIILSQELVSHILSVGTNIFTTT